MSKADKKKRSNPAEKPDKEVPKVPAASAADAPADRAPATPAASPVPVMHADESEAYVPEDQHQRWLKYGANVALTTLVVLVLAGIAIWAFNADRIPLGKSSISLKARKDLTSEGSNQLKPQTVALIRDLDKEVTLVSLYPKLKKEDAVAKGADTHGKVLDILDEYRKNGKNIKVEAIDPIADPGKVDAWLGELKRKYGKNIENYEKFVKEFPKTLDEIKKLAEPEAEQLRALFGEIEKIADKLTDEQSAMLAGTLRPAYSTVVTFPKLLAGLNEAATAELEQKIPDYAGAVQVIKSGDGFTPGLTFLSRQCGALATVFTRLKDEKTAPDPVKKYAEGASARFAKIKEKADESLKKTESLGELKLDEVRKKLMPTEEGQTAPPPAIAVMGPDDVRVIDDRSLWNSGAATGMTGPTEEKPRLRFAGESQLTSAIIGVAQQKKQKVAIIRAGGPPKLGGGANGFGDVGERLRAYNYEVVEKDFGMQDPRRGPPPQDVPEEEIKDAIWVVFSSAPDQQAMMMGMPPQTGVLGDKLKAHLDNGGSAICLVDVQGEDLAAALRDWGIEVKSNTVLIHERIKGGEADSEDFIEQARRQPPIFVLNNFGQHAITSPIQALDFAAVYMVPVKRAGTIPAGVTVSELMPIPNSPRSWGETDLSFIFGSGDDRRPPEPTYDKDADLAAPLYLAAAAEKQGKGRLVVIGCQYAFRSGMLNLPDPKLLKNKPPVVVSRFPANGELFTNSIFWLSRNEKMIALSPSAMDTARISAVAPGTLGFLKVGIVLVTLPLLAVAAGVGVWMTRRG